MCEPCSAFNINLTDLKDQQYLGTIPAVDSLVEDFRQQQDLQGVAVGVVIDNDIHYLKAYGIANLGQPEAGVAGTPIDFTVATPSSVGSISKTLTALGILRLYERGLVDLDAHVEQYLPPWAVYNWHNEETMTIGRLLRHQSGIRNAPEWGFPSTEAQLQMAFPGAGPHPGIHPRYALWGYITTPVIGFAPGSSARYSNTGYALLGAVIDYVTHNAELDPQELGYENFIWWNVAMKGGVISGHTMHSPCLNAYWRQDDILNLALDYPRDEESFTGMAYTGWEGPAGGWTMTIGDLARLMIMINTNQIISPETTAEMMDRDQAGQDYDAVGDASLGMGVLLHEYDDEEIFLHTGRIGHYSARYVMWPESGMGVALMTNGEANLRDLAYNIRDEFAQGSGGGIMFTNEDLERVNTAVYRLVSLHQHQMANLVGVFQSEHPTLEKALRKGVKSLLGVEDGKKFLRYALAGKYEEAATLALRFFEESGSPLSGPAATLGPIPREDGCRCCGDD